VHSWSARVWTLLLIGTWSCTTAKNVYDIAVIGGGSASEAPLRSLEGSGMSVVMFEPKLVGGECPFVACMPSKSMLHDAACRRTHCRVAHCFRRRSPLSNRAVVDRGQRSVDGPTLRIWGSRSSDSTRTISTLPIRGGSLAPAQYGSWVTPPVESNTRTSPTATPR
jgi:hypothetical protein